MPRNGSGTYSLPAGNPVVSGTTIQASWANSTLADISTELTGSLARSGAGGMLGALRGVDGTVSVPAFSFTSETTSGLYRAGTGDVRFAMAGADVYTVTSTGVTFAANPVLSAGTANGVSYLNASKAVTTSSNFTYDGTALTLSSSTAFYPQIITRNKVNDTTASYLVLDKDRAGSIVQNGDALGAIVWRSFDGTNYLQSAAIIGYSGGTPGTNDVPGALAFFTTADGASSPTERMRLDASGNIGLNGTSPSAWFGYKALQSDQSSLYESSNTVGLSSNSYYPSAGSSWTRISALATARYDITSGVHKWFADASGAAGGSFTPTERMQLDNSGNLLVGTTTSAARMTVEGAALVAKFKRTSSGGIAQFQNGSDAGFGIDLLNVAGTSAGSIYWTATTTTYATSSDRRLKENVVVAPSASAAIDAIQIVSYDWKAAPNEPHTTYGVIAQDLHTVAPEAVSVGDDGDTVEKPWGVDYSKLVPLLIKEIQSLRARVAALEAA